MLHTGLGKSWVGHVHEEQPSQWAAGPDTGDDAVRDAALLVARRRMFSDLSDAERDDLVATAVDAAGFSWGPPGRPEDLEAGDLEAWLAAGMFHAMMNAFRERRMLRPPFRRGDATTLDGLLERWVSTEPSFEGHDLPTVDPELVDRFLRQLSPADARLLWMQCEGYTREEIAAMLGIRANAVSVRLRRLRIRLRETLEPLTGATTTGATTAGTTTTGTTMTGDEKQPPSHGVA